MDSLPEDLTRDILSKLRDVKHLANFSAACKAFYSVRWPCLYAGNGELSRGALLSRHMSGLKGISILVRDKTDWQECKILIEKSSSTLEEISFGWSSMDLVDDDMWSFLEKFPRLSSIRMDYNQYASSRHSFPNLRSANLSLNDIGEDDIQNLLKSAPLLETLKLFWLWYGMLRGECKFKVLEIEEGRNLKVLEIHSSGLTLSVAKCERLETLRVSFVQGLALGYESLPNLRNINIKGGTLDSLLLCGLLDVENLVITCTNYELSEGCQVLTIPGDKLKSLEYHGHVQDKKLRVERCEKLESLDVSRAESFELGGPCPRLRKARVSGVKKFGDKQLSELLFDSPRLKELEIDQFFGSHLITLCSSALEKLYFNHWKHYPRTTLNVKCDSFTRLRLSDNCLVELADCGSSIPTHVCLNGRWSRSYLRQFTRLAFVTKLLHLELDIEGTLDLEEKARIAVTLLTRSVTTVTMVAHDKNDTSDLEKAIKHLARKAVRFSPQLQRITFNEVPAKEGTRIQQALEEIKFRDFSYSVTSVDLGRYRVDVLRSIIL